jgi:hypothetical protein
VHTKACKGLPIAPPLLILPTCTFSKFYAPILHSALLFFIRTLKVGILQFKSKTLENYIYRLSIYKVGFLYYIGCGIVYIKSRVTVLHRARRPINSSSYLPE